MQRSQATALTRALGIQENYERSQQRSGATSTSDGGSTSTQFQTLNSVAREVNRRLGLSDDSTVGKSVAASASVGAKSLTEIGAQARAEGRQMDQQPFRAPTTSPARRQKARSSRRRAPWSRTSDHPMPINGHAAIARHPPPATTRRSVMPASGRPPATTPMVERANSPAPRSSCASGAAARRPTSPTTRRGVSPSAGSCAKKTRSSCSAR